MIISPAKTAEPTKMPLGVGTQMGPSQDPLTEMGILGGHMPANCKV